MQELAFLLTGLAGAASAVAFAKFPRNTPALKIIGANPRIQKEIAYMEVERDILVKTVSRLYQHDAKVDGEKRGKLLSKYQHQLGIVLARIEKLEIASKHPDMGPIGDGLVTLMDQKLSALDEKLHEISSKISATSIQTEAYERSSSKESKPRIHVPKISSIQQEKISQMENVRSRVEITTLTPLAKRSQSFVPPEPKIQTTQTAMQQSELKTEYRPVIDTPRPDISKPAPKPEYTPAQQSVDIPKQEPLITPPKVIQDLTPEQDADLEDTSDLDKLKKDIMKTLEKLDQVEVE